MSSFHLSLPASSVATLTALASSLLLAGCLGGGGSGGEPVVAAPQGPASGPVAGATTLSGTVAVGAPISNGTLRILDATGAVVASGIALDASGRYAGVTLTGPAPYRLEACGNAGAEYLCMYSVASAAGTANVTPLTTATVLLATGQAPDGQMAGSAPASLTPAALSAAQDQLRASLASVLASAGASSSLDFISGTLDAGSRTGYDAVLDAVGVATGQDTHAFVQITPRIGQGNLYLEPGSTSGTITAPSASDLQLAGLETLFRDLTAALASDSACSAEATGVRRSLATNARLSTEGGTVQGAAPVAQALCQFFSQGDDGSTPMWGARLMSPTLGRCDTAGSAPVCNVSFVIQSPQGEVMPVGNGMAVTRESGTWRLLGDLPGIAIHASAKAQRTVRLDTAAPVVEFSRAFAFDIPAVAGLQCARVAQRDAGGTLVPMAFYKAFGGSRLSLWTTDGHGNTPSLSPAFGAMRSRDDTWIALPTGSEGDAVIRNFYRGGRSATVTLYSDAACSLPFALDGRSEFEVEVDGVPPVWSAMEFLPWPSLDGTTSSTLRSMTIAAGGSGSMHVGWSFGRGPLGINGVTLCTDRADCGQGGVGRIGGGSLRPGVSSADVAFHNDGTAVAADDFKLVALYGRTGERLDMQSNFETCPGAPEAENCH